MGSTELATQKPKFDVLGKNLEKLNCKTLDRKTYFA